MMKQSGIEARLPQKEREENGAAEQGGMPSIEEMAGELAMLKAAGKLPEGFDFQTACADEAFIELMQEFPAAAAVRIYQAEKNATGAEQSAMQRMNERYAARNALPRSTRSGIAASPKPDFDNMSSEAFRAYEQQLKRAAARGVRVPL